MALLGKNANKSVRSANFINGISRTKCPRHFKWRSTFSAGYLIPMFCDEFLPAETKSVDFGTLLRTITPLGPTMDNMFLDVFCFFVPRRLVWDHWEEFIAGYNKEAWAQDIEYTVPKIKFKTFTQADEDWFNEHKNDYAHSFLDYMPGATDPVDLLNAQLSYYDADEDDKGESVVNGCFAIDACYPRSYVKLWNDWFRDENLQDELELYTGDDDEYADEFAFNLLDATKIPKAAKYHNRFTTALPAPQKGPDVLIPMNNLALSGDLEVGYYPKASGDLTSEAHAYLPTGTTIQSGTFKQIEMNNGGISGARNSVVALSSGVTASNLTNTIRMLRLATQTELLLARDARGGTRYVESLLSHFGVHNGDARLQRAEYLGSRQIPLNIMQVTNTAGTATDALGNVGGQSCTKDNAHYFTYSATEHGILWIVGVVRVNLSYSSGIRKIYQRFNRFDHIWPEFKHIGDVPLYKREIETNEIIENPDEVFGYTPYGSELREGYNFNNGLFRSKFNSNLAYLTFQEEYDDDAAIQLSAEYIESTDVPVKKTLIDQNGPQFYGLFDLYMEDTIPLDPTSDPGLMDHL